MLITSWDPPGHSIAQGYWYRCGIAEYSEEHVEPELKERIVKGEFKGVEGIPAVGVYKDKYFDLNPCFLKVSDIRWYKNETYPCKFSIEFYGEHIPLNSLHLLKELEKIKGKTRYLFFEIGGYVWDKIVKSLNITTPQWWNRLRFIKL